MFLTVYNVNYLLGIISSANVVNQYFCHLLSYIFKFANFLRPPHCSCAERLLRDCVLTSITSHDQSTSMTFGCRSFFYALNVRLQGKEYQSMSYFLTLQRRPYSFTLPVRILLSWSCLTGLSFLKNTHERSRKTFEAVQHLVLIKL